MKRSFTLLSAALMVMVLAAHAHADEPQPIIRTSLKASKECWVGQRMTLVVELLVPGYFSGSPDFDMPDPPGLLLVPPLASPTLASETIGQTTYTVQRHELFIFARRPGPQSVPPIIVQFHFKRHPLDKESESGVMKTKEVHFTAESPPGAENLGNIITAKNLTAEETWNPQPTKAKVGDALTRTITYAAPDVPAIAFPPFPAEKIDGIAIYAKPPQVTDENDRGQIHGRRRDTFSYVLQRPGQFTIPAARLSWFDLAAQKVQVIDFPARTLDVAANPSMGGSTITETKSHIFDLKNLTIVAIGFALILSISYLVWRNWIFLTAPFRPVRLAPLNPSEP